MKKMLNKNEKGITLIALVITIIVLIILAGIAISMLRGENGILNKTNSAKTENETSTVEEQVKLAALAALTEGSGKIEGGASFKALNDGLKAAGYNGKIEEDVTWPAIIEIGGSSYKIDKNGTVTKVSNGNVNSGEVDWDSILSNLADNYDEYLKSAQNNKGQVSDTNIGIGTDGKVVNLDLWHYFKTDDGKSMSLGKGEGSNTQAAYDEKNILNGKLQGKFPQYIFVKEEEKTYSVTELNSIFGYYMEGKGVEQIPEIPTTVKILGYSAFGGTILKNITIPDSVEIIKNNAFYDCQNLETVKFSNSLKIIDDDAFGRCIKLDGIVLPSSLEKIDDGSFRYCKSLSSINIPAKVRKVGWYAFDDCDNLVNIYIEAENFNFDNNNPDNSFAGLFQYEVPSRVLYFKNNEALEALKKRYATIYEEEYDAKYGELKVKE